MDKRGRLKTADAFKVDSDTTPLRKRSVPARRTIRIPASLTIKKLADMAGLKPFQIVAGLMELGLFANVDHVLDFATAANVLKRFNVIAEPEQ